MSPEVCSVCFEKDAKYVCPACEARTCSLECVKRHKIRSECTGLVNPTKFISNKDLSSNQALVNRDYNFLINFERRIQLGKDDLRERNKQILKRNFNQPRNPKRRRVAAETEDHRLAMVEKIYPNSANTSIKRLNTMVVHLPPGMSRNSQNKSAFDRKSNTFTWTVEWIPIDSKHNTLSSFTSFRLKEDLALSDAIPLAILGKAFGEQEVQKHHLNFYLKNCICLSPRTSSLIRLNPDQPIASALKDRVVLEFPTIYVSLAPIDSPQFEILDDYGFNDSSSSSDDSQSTTESTESSTDSDTASEDESQENNTICPESGSDDNDSDDVPEESSSKPPPELEEGPH